MRQTAEQIDATYSRVTWSDYDPNGNLVLVAVARNDVPNIAAATEQTEAQFLQTRRTGYVHDRLGRMTSVTEAWAPAGTIKGDTTGRTYQKAVEDDLKHASPVTSYLYDAEDRAISVTNPRGVVSKYSYDVLGRLRSANEGAELPAAMKTDIADLDYAPGETRYSYDLGDRLTGVANLDNQVPDADPRWVWTKFGYDPHDRKNSTTEGVVTTGKDADQPAESLLARRRKWCTMRPETCAR